MKSLPWVLPVALCLISLSLAQPPGKPTPGAEESIFAPPPASLDNFYPPKSPAPVFQIGMIELAGAMTGIGVNLFAGDFANAGRQYENFRAKYSEISKKIPEWADRYPMAPVDKLGEALKGGKQDEVMAAIGEVDQVCSRCHVATVTKVQHKYHWPDTRDMMIDDPVTGQTVLYRQFMHFLAMSFEGIAVDIQEGQPENAAWLHADFDRRFQTLRESCGNCHTTDRKYYVDESVQGMIAELGQAIASPAPDPQRIQNLSVGIGQESCFKCHLVHMPATLSKAGWEASAKSH